MTKIPKVIFSAAFLMGVCGSLFALTRTPLQQSNAAIKVQQIAGTGVINSSARYLDVTGTVGYRADSKLEVDFQIVFEDKLHLASGPDPRQNLVALKIQGTADVVRLNSQYTANAYGILKSNAPGAVTQNLAGVPVDIKLRTFGGPVVTVDLSNVPEAGDTVRYEFPLDVDSAAEGRNVQHCGFELETNRPDSPNRQVTYYIQYDYNSFDNVTDVTGIVRNEQDGQVEFHPFPKPGNGWNSGESLFINFPQHLLSFKINLVTNRVETASGFYGLIPINSGGQVMCQPK